jgi:dethiobiotin synthetase
LGVQLGRPAHALLWKVLLRQMVLRLTGWVVQVMAVERGSSGGASVR